MLKRRMEPVKKMPFEEFTIPLKEIVPIGKRGKEVICKDKLYRTGMLIRHQGERSVQISKATQPNRMKRQVPQTSEPLVQGWQLLGWFGCGPQHSAAGTRRPKYVARRGQENLEVRCYHQVRLPEVRAKVVERWFAVRAFPAPSLPRLRRSRLIRSIAGTSPPLTLAAPRLTGRERHVPSRPVRYQNLLRVLWDDGYWCDNLENRLLPNSAGSQI